MVTMVDLRLSQAPWCAVFHVSMYGGHWKADISLIDIFYVLFWLRRYQTNMWFEETPFSVCPVWDRANQHCLSVPLSALRWCWCLLDGCHTSRMRALSGWRGPRDLEPVTHGKVAQQEVKDLNWKQSWTGSVWDLSVNLFVYLLCQLIVCLGLCMQSDLSVQQFQIFQSLWGEYHWCWTA